MSYDYQVYCEILAAIGIHHGHVADWLRAMARPSGRALAAFCSQLSPMLARSGSGEDLADWVKGNRGVSQDLRAIGELSEYGADWPVHIPVSVEEFRRHLLMGQATALLLATDPMPGGMAPALWHGRLHVLRYAVDQDGDTTWGLHSVDANKFDAWWDYDRYRDGATIGTPGLPSLAAASAALSNLFAVPGAGWIVSASR